MKMFKKFLAVLGLASACSVSAAEFSSLSVEEFEVAIKSDSILIVDVRTPAEFAENHIDGALNLDINNVAFVKNAEALDKSKQLAVYCRSGKRSKKAANVLTDLGFKVVELNTGILGWKSSGKSVVK